MTFTMKIVDGDWVLASNGQVETVEGRTKVRQDLRELFSTERQRNGFGTYLRRIIGATDDPYAVQALIEDEISTGVANLRRLQETYQRAQRTATERVTTLVSIDVSQTAAGGGEVETGYSYTAVIGVAAGDDLGMRGTL